jgi:hypothetical protein
MAGNFAAAIAGSEVGGGFAFELAGDFSKAGLYAKTLPVRCWQARQWQMETRAGSPSQWILSWPQEQVAVRVMVLKKGVVFRKEQHGGLLGWSIA